jgi:hypothetical protein
MQLAFKKYTKTMFQSFEKNLDVPNDIFYSPVKFQCTLPYTLGREMTGSNIAEFFSRTRYNTDAHIYAYTLTLMNAHTHTPTPTPMSTSEGLTKSPQTPHC